MLDKKMKYSIHTNVVIGIWKAMVIINKALSDEYIYNLNFSP